jgi:AbrB family looped-hinge helix DNA binding protein
MTTKLTIDKAGRVVIPKPIRDELALEQGTELELVRDGDSITLRPVRAKGGLCKERGFWVFSSGSGKELPAETVNDLIDSVRAERERSILGEED